MLLVYATMVSKSRWDTHNITVVRCLNLTLFFSFARIPPLNSELRSTTRAWRRGRMIDYFVSKLDMSVQTKASSL